MATLQNMVVRLGLDANDLKSGLARSAGYVRQFDKDVNKSSANLRKFAGSATALGGSLSSMPMTLGATVTAVGLLSKALPVATTGLIALPAAAAVGGAAFATMATATSGMSDALTALADGDTEKVAEAMKKLSPAAGEMARAMHGVGQSFEPVRKAVQEALFAGMGKQVSDLGARYMPVLQSGMTGVASGFSVMAASAMSAMNTPFFQGAVERVFTATKNSLSNLTPAVQPLVNALGNLMIAGAPLIEQFTAWLGKLGETKLGFLGSAEGLAYLEQKIQSGKEAFDSLMAVIGPLWGGIQSLATVFMTIAGWINQLPPGVQGVVGSMVVWGFTIGMLVSKFAPLFSMLGMFGPKLLTAGMSVVSFGGKVVMGLAKASLAMAQYVVKLIAQGVVIAARWTMMAVGAMARAVVMAAAWVVAMGPVGWVIAIIIGLVILIIANWDKVKAWTIAAWNAVVDFIVSAWNSIVNWVTTAANNVWNAIKTAFNNAKTAVSDAINGIIDFVRSLPGKILGFLGNLGGLLVDSGRAIIDGLLRGLKAAWEGVKSFLSSVTNMIPDWKGPMTVDMKLLTPNGKAIMQGLQRGIAAELPSLEAQLGGITQTIGNGVAGPADVSAGGSSDSRINELRQAFAGTKFVIDNEGGRILAKAVNDVNGGNGRR